MAFERFWHTQYPAGVPRDVDFEKVTLPAALERTAQRFPGTVAINFMGRLMPYRELNDLVNRFALTLEGLGIRPGDRVATLLPNIPQMTIAVYGTFRAGAVVVPTNPLYTERELEHQLNDSGARVLVALDLLEPRLDAVLPKTGITATVYCHINDYLAFPRKQLFPLVKKHMHRKIKARPGVLEFARAVSAPAPGGAADRSQWEDLAALMYTGGTTGVSKGVMMLHCNLSSNVQQWKAAAVGMEDGNSSILAIFPYFHSAGFTAVQNHTIWRGWTAILVPRPEPGTIIELIRKFKPNFVPGVPTIFNGLLNSEKFRKLDLSKIQGFFAGAAPLAPETLERLRKLTGATIINVYGLTETAPLATSNPWGGVIAEGTVGVPLPGTDARIVDLETGEKEMPVGEAGELILKGPQVMTGYYNRPDETAKVLRDGWLYTGDIAAFDAAGNITILDRKKDMIIASGFNIYPCEIDDILYSHPKVLEACAIGVPDEYRGETVKAYVVPRPGETLTEQDVIDFCREKLAAYKVPKKIAFIDAIPKSAVGKILRREMKALDEKLSREAAQQAG